MTLTDEEIQDAYRDLVGKTYKNKFVEGDQLALFECVLMCQEHHIRIPIWATDALANAMRSYLVGNADNLDMAFFGSKSRMGQLAKLATKRHQIRKDQLIIDIGASCRRQGMKGDALYERTQEIYHQCCLAEPNTIRVQIIEDSDSPPDDENPSIETIKKKLKPLGTLHERASPLSVSIGVMFHEIDSSFSTK